MELLKAIIDLIHANCIRTVFISVLVILPFRYFFKNKIDTHYALQILRGLILSYAALALIHFILTILSVSENEPPVVFINRAFGPYWWAYWMMFLGHSILPFLLTTKRIGTNAYLLLLIALLMNIGWLFESFVIHMTNLHRDFVDHSGHCGCMPFDHEITLIIKGICLGVLVLLIGNGIKYFNPSKHSINPN
ncbi:MAG: hypothetical protein K0R51_730 [Cytophagaceae bacterium]|jgi:hypothetical protein|nr:hypothetical protein [Cytophagaceae bacterium]